MVQEHLKLTAHPKGVPLIIMLLDGSRIEHVMLNENYYDEISLQDQTTRVLNTKIKAFSKELELERKL